jgi:hypothetical protein
MNSEFQVPFCPECGGPLKNWPTRTKSVRCDFCGSNVFGTEEVLHEMEAKYSNVYKEFLEISREFPDTIPVGDDVRIFRVPLKSNGTKYDVLVVLRDFPERISVDYPRGLQNLIGPPRYLESLKNWIPDGSKPIEVLREIQDNLTGGEYVKPPTKGPLVESWETLGNQFQVESIGADKKRVSLYSPRTHFELNFQIKKKKTSVSLGNRLVRSLPEAQTLGKRYNNGEITLTDFLGRMEFGINTQDRIITEIQMLRNNYTQLRYHPNTRQISLSIPVGSKPLHLVVSIPPRFPIMRPEVTLASEVSDEKVKRVVEERLNAIAGMWNRHMHILDLLSEVQAAVIGVMYKQA